MAKRKEAGKLISEQKSKGRVVKRKQTVKLIPGGQKSKGGGVKAKHEEAEKWILGEEITEAGARQLVSAPDIWIKEGVLLWPPEGADASSLRRKRELPQKGWITCNFKILGRYNSLQEALEKEKYLQKFSNSESEREELKRKAFKRKHPVAVNLIDANDHFDSIKLQNEDNTNNPPEQIDGESIFQENMNFEQLLAGDLHVDFQSSQNILPLIGEVIDMQSNHQYDALNYVPISNLIGYDNIADSGTDTSSTKASNSFSTNDTYETSSGYGSIVSSSFSSYPSTSSSSTLVSSCIPGTYPYHSSNTTYNRQDSSTHFGTTNVSNSLIFQPNATRGYQLLNTDNGVGKSMVAYNPASKHYPTPVHTYYPITTNAGVNNAGNGINQCGTSSNLLPHESNPNNYQLLNTNAANGGKKATIVNNVVRRQLIKEQYKHESQPQENGTLKNSCDDETKSRKNQERKQKSCGKENGRNLKSVKKAVNKKNLKARKLHQVNKKQTVKREQLVKSVQSTPSIKTPSSSGLVEYINNFTPSPTHGMEGKNTQIDYLPLIYKEILKVKADRVKTDKIIVDIEQRQLEIFEKLENIEKTSATNRTEEEMLFADENIEEFDTNFPCIGKEKLDAQELTLLTEPVHKAKLTSRLAMFGGKRAQLMVRSCMKYIVDDPTLDKYTWIGTPKKYPFKKLKTLNTVIFNSVRRNFRKFTRYRYRKYMVQYLKHSTSRQRKKVPKKKTLKQNDNQARNELEEELEGNDQDDDETDEDENGKAEEKDVEDDDVEDDNDAEDEHEEDESEEDEDEEDEDEEDEDEGDEEDEE